MSSSHYELKNFETPGNLGNFQYVTFFEKNPDGTVLQEGTTVEEMIRVSVQRLNYLNSQFPCRENSLAITKLEEALHWLNHRTADRIARGVEGKHEA